MFRFKSLETTINNAKSSNVKEQDEYTKLSTLERQEAMATWYRDGGKVAISWIKENYKTHSGVPLRWNDTFLEPFVAAFCNPWIEEFVVNKSAQIGFSEISIAFCAFVTAFLRSPLGLGFESRTKVHLMMGQRVQRAFSYCGPIQRLSKSLNKLTNSEDIDSRETITIGGVPLNTFYSKVEASKGDEQTASTMRSFPANAIFIDEFGLCEPGIERVAAARMEASDWKCKPFIRLGSTPGLEGGQVDKKVRTAKYDFRWEVICPCCTTAQYLDPFGNFLRWVQIEEDGVMEERVVDKIGKPLAWYHHSVNPSGLKDWQLTGKFREEAIATAYIGCQDCRLELDWDTRSNGQFRCKNTGELLLEFCNRLLVEQKPLRGTVAIDLPKLASKSFDPVQRLDFMFITDCPAQGIQEFLGRAISLGGGKISLKRLQECVGLTLLIPRKPDLKVAGVDQGKYSNWYIWGDVYLNNDAHDKKQRWRDAIVDIKDWGEFVGFDFLEQLTSDHNLDIIGIDNEPEYNSVVDYALKHLPRKTVPAINPRIPRDRSGFNQVCEARVFNQGSIIPFEAYLMQYGWEFVNKREDSDPFYCAYYQIVPRSAGATPVRELDRLLTQNMAAAIALPHDLEEDWKKPYEPEPNPLVTVQTYLFDQVELKGEQFRRNLRQVGNPGKTVRRAKQKERLVPIYSIDRTFGLDAVRDRVYRRLLYLPYGTTYNPKDKANLLYHLVTSDRLPDGKWVEPPGAPDHYHHCLSFLELAVLCSLYEPGMQGSGFTSIPQDEFDSQPR